MKDQVSSLSGEQILANAIALAPMIRECRDEIERERRLAMRLVDAMKRAAEVLHQGRVHSCREESRTLLKSIGAARLDQFLNLEMIKGAQ